MKALKIMLPAHAGYFSTLHLLASLQRRNSRKSAQTVVFAGATLRGQGSKEKSPMRASGT